MSASMPTVGWRGVNHLALVTKDMDATVRFWHGVLGARLVVAFATPEFRHYFFEIAPSNTVAFFEYAAAEPLEQFAKPAGVPFRLASQFDHLSLGVEDEAALLALRDRLTRHGCEVTEVVDHQFVRSVYFTDPNGIALEASWWVQDATGRIPSYAQDGVLFADPHPVPALRELLERGELDHTVATRLVDGVTALPAS